MIKLPSGIGHYVIPNDDDLFTIQQAVVKSRLQGKKFDHLAEWESELRKKEESDLQDYDFLGQETFDLSGGLLARKSYYARTGRYTYTDLPDD